MLEGYRAFADAPFPFLSLLISPSIPANPKAKGGIFPEAVSHTTR